MINETVRVDASLVEVKEPLDYVRAYRPKPIDSAVYQLQRVLCGGRECRGTFGQSQFSLVALPYRPIPAAQILTFRVTLSQCEFYLEVGPDFLVYALNVLGLDHAIDHLNHSLREAVCTAFLELFLTQSFRQSPLSIRGMTMGDQRDLSGMTLEYETEPSGQLQLQAYFHKDLCGAATRWLQSFPSAQFAPSHEVAQLPVIVTLLLDQYFMAKFTIDAVRLGSILLTDAAPGGCIVQVGHLQQKGKIMDQELTLDGYLNEFDGAVDSATSQTTYERARPFEQHSTDLGQIPMKVSFRLASLRLTVEQVRQLNEKKCIPLKSVVDDQVEVLVNDQPYALGEMVSIDDQIGVRVLNFFDTGLSD